MRSLVRIASLAVATFALTVPAAAQHAAVGAALTPYAGYLVTGDWYNGPLGTSLSSSNAPMLGVQANIPLTRGVALVGNLAYASGDLRVGLPIIGGVNIGTTNTWLYDGGLEIGGLAKGVGIAPFVQVGVGGMSTDIKNRLVDTHTSSLAYTGALGIDLGLSRSLSVRVQAKDWVGRFDSRDAIGVSTKANLAHNIALTGGVKLAF